MRTGARSPPGIRPRRGAAGLNLGLTAVTDGDFVAAERLFRVAAESDHPEARVAGAINLAGALVLKGADTWVYPDLGGPGARVACSAGGPWHHGKGETPEAVPV